MKNARGGGRSRSQSPRRELQDSVIARVDTIASRHYEQIVKILNTHMSVDQAALELETARGLLLDESLKAAAAVAAAVADERDPRRVHQLLDDAFRSAIERTIARMEAEGPPAPPPDPMLIPPPPVRRSRTLREARIQGNRLYVRLSDLRARIARGRA